MSDQFTPGPLLRADIEGGFETKYRLAVEGDMHTRIVGFFDDSALAMTAKRQRENDYERAHHASIAEADAMLWTVLAQVRERRS